MAAAMRLVLDTNVLLSGIAYPGSVPGKIVTAWRHASVEVFLSPYILNELRRVLPRLRARHGMTDAEIDDLIDILQIQAEILTPDPVADAIRDTNDLPILGTLAAGLRLHTVDYLITGDKDLLALSDRYPIVTPADFWARHAGV